MSHSYRWTIEDFQTKMENFKLGQQLESSQFSINGFKLCINLYPNGRNEEEGGFVSLFLRNDNSFQLEVMCEFVLGERNTHKHNFSFNKVNPNSGYGFPKMYSHEQIVSKQILEEGRLEIKAVITFKGKVKNICRHSEEERGGEAGGDEGTSSRVGTDLLKSFESQEFCDFEIVCGDRGLRCHKVVLAARSPVLRAMLLNQMEETVNQKLEPKNFDLETMQLLLRYLYRGQVEPGQLERHAEPLFRAADYYEITDLKVACERVLTRQLTIRNMLDRLVLADLFKAAQLKAASKRLIVANSKELVKQKDWRKRFGDSQHLVCEVLEAVIAQAE